MDPSKVPLSAPDIANPFGAPVYYRETVTSTMDEARSVALGGAPHGTVIAAGYQSAGRGRGGRLWNMERGGSLPFTLILRYPAARAIPPCLTLRAGLALSFAIEDFIENFIEEFIGDVAAGLGRKSFAGRVQVKWPNDIMLIQEDGAGKKAAGVLAEAAGFSDVSGGALYLGIGVNAAQGEFPPELAKKACSIAGTLYPARPGKETPALYAALAEKRFILLEKILGRLYMELEGPGHGSTDTGPKTGKSGAESFVDKTGKSAAHNVANNAVNNAGEGWRERLLERLYMRGKPVRFIPGAAGSKEAVEGVLEGIGGAGELLITVDGETRSFITGELAVYEEF